ncbi:MAG TPA: methyltransferase domain-containing protein [Ktedonobacteraceae bacterium]|jgi:ubiquinone/menaquinone biosynthesis C-methylase UbiE|nr:methyltransferase domain-containing protein [Ktedonobacteraceae bacterium]
MQSGDQQREDTYVMDPESMTEMARLINQHVLITEHMGGLFPPEVDPTALTSVLDLACGPGGWVLDVARAYPEIEVVGVDISQTMITYAKARAKSQGLKNAKFQVMNILKPFTFPDQSFDMVNVRFLVGVLSPGDWPHLIEECKRVLRPGGILRLTDVDDLGITNSAALEQITALGAKAARMAKRAFFSEGRYVGTMIMLARFLRDAGFQDIHQQAHMIDWSAGTDAFPLQYDNARMALQLGSTFLTKMGVVTQEQFDDLYYQAEIDMNSSDFVAVMLYLTAWGRLAGDNP